MAGKSTTPVEVSQALALREVGYTVLSISQRLGISTRTVQRHLATHGAAKGTLKEAVLTQARADLLKRITSDDTIREEAAKLINDDLAHAHHLRSILMEASEHLKATNLDDAVLVMRAAVAYSSAMKNTSDTLRQSLRLDKAPLITEDQLPQLVVRELTLMEVTALRLSECEEQPDDVPAFPAPPEGAVLS